MFFTRNFILLVIIVLFFNEIELLCQQNYTVTGVVYILDGKTDKIDLLLKNKNNSIKVPVDLDGNFSVSLIWNETYNFKFTKPGYVSKSITFMTNVPDQINKKTILPYELQVELFPIYPHVDSMFYTKPVAIIEYNGTEKDFTYDLDYHLSIQAKVEKAKKDYLNWVDEYRNTTPHMQYKTIKTENRQNTSAYSVKAKSRITNSEINTTESVNEKSSTKTDPFGLPPVNYNFSERKNVEIFQLKSKTVTRVMINKNGYKSVYYQVKHNWGGVYYFVLVSPQYYKSISADYFENSTNY